MKLSIIGAGKWGTALAHAFRENEKNIVHISSYHTRDLPNFIPADEAMSNGIW